MDHCHMKYVCMARWSTVSRTLSLHHSTIPDWSTSFAFTGAGRKRYTVSASSLTPRDLSFDFETHAELVRALQALQVCIPAQDIMNVYVATNRVYLIIFETRITLDVSFLVCLGFNQQLSQRHPKLGSNRVLAWFSG